MFQELIAGNCNIINFWKAQRGHPHANHEKQTHPTDTKASHHKTNIERIKNLLQVKACLHLDQIWSMCISHFNPLHTKLDQSTLITSIHTKPDQSTLITSADHIHTTNLTRCNRHKGRHWFTWLAASLFVVTSSLKKPTKIVWRRNAW